MNKKFYITTAIPYVNAAPHIGHALEFVQTDAIARFHRLLSEEVWFLTGTDENALKNVRAAEEHNIPIGEFIIKNSHRFKSLLARLGISNNDFIQTTEPRHVKGAQALWNACRKEDIYKKSYKGLYCVGCEAFYTEKDLVGGVCPEHKKPLELVEEENYFFKLSNYQKWLEEIIESDQLRIVPEIRKNEVLSFIGGGLEDFSISRSVARAHGWGIGVPGDETQIIYVWFDALANYITAMGWNKNDEKFRKFWPADCHVIGKGISRFHAIYWPAMLKSAGIKPPKEIFIHGYITVEGEKISKSLGNVIDPNGLLDKFGADPLRYYLLREIPSFGDGDFSYQRFYEVYNSELANNLGNLVSRVTKLADGLIGDTNKIEIDGQITEYFDRYAIDLAIKYILDTWINPCNLKLNEVKPWALEKDDLKRKAVLLECISNLRKAVYHLQPVIPTTAQKIETIFSGTIRPLEKPLFPRINGETKQTNEKIILSDRRYWVDKQAASVGVKFQVAEIYGVTVKRRNSKLEKDKKVVAGLVKKTNYSNDLILQGYEKLFETIGVKGVSASPVPLIQLVSNKGSLPTINTVVDAYNIKSIETKLVVSAHDLDKLKGDVRIVITTGKEIFYPLGSSTTETLPANEWAAVDDSHTLCRLNCKQSELSKVTPKTKNLLIYVQGSRTTSDEYLQQSLVDICEYIVKCNGGKYVILKEQNKWGWVINKNKDKID